MARREGEGRRHGRAPTEQDRSRALVLIWWSAADSLISSRAADDAIEGVCRAKSAAELDAVLARLPRNPHAAADLVLTHGLPTAAAARRPGPWWRSSLLLALGASVLWFVIWLVTGGAVGWLVLAFAFTAITFTVRLSLGHRRQATGRSRRRRGIL